MSDNVNEQDASQQPRQPRNLPDVLRYAVEAGTNSENPPTEPTLQPIDPERRRFLEEALHCLTEDVAAVLREAIETLKGLSKDTQAPQTYENALDIIAERVDSIDAANDYVKLGGFTIIDECLKSPHAGIRWRIADIIAQCTQNNPFCQEHALKLRVLEKLIVMVSEDPDERCNVKSFFAMSNIVRESAVGLNEFMRLNGFQAVKKAMKSNNQRLSNKAAFFFSSLIHNQNIIWDVVSMGFSELLISLLSDELSPSHEFIASSLLVLVQQSKEALVVCKKKDLKLEEILSRIIEDNKSDECYTELVDYSKELLKAISKP